MLDDIKLNQIKYYLKDKLITDHWTDSQDAMIRDLFNEVLRLTKLSNDALSELEECDKREEIIDGHIDDYRNKIIKLENKLELQYKDSMKIISMILSLMTKEQLIELNILLNLITPN